VLLGAWYATTATLLDPLSTLLLAAATGAEDCGITRAADPTGAGDWIGGWLVAADGDSTGA